MEEWNKDFHIKKDQEKFHLHTLQDLKQKQNRNLESML